MKTTTAAQQTGMKQQEFEKLFSQHSAMVYRAAYSVTGNKHEAQDVLQDLFLTLIDHGLGRPGRVGHGCFSEPASHGADEPGFLVADRPREAGRIGPAILCAHGIGTRNASAGARPAATGRGARETSFERFRVVLVLPTAGR